MSAFAMRDLPPFAAEVAEGLSAEEKHLESRHLYDEIGTGLFEIATMLPECGTARAEERLLKRYSPELAQLLGPLSLIAELGSGNNRAAAHISPSISDRRSKHNRTPASSIDTPEISRKALSPSTPAAPVQQEEWLKRATSLLSGRTKNQPVLLTLLGSSTENLDRAPFCSFLRRLRERLKPGDYFLFAADLVKDSGKMLVAYDDSAGVMAAFNKNLLVRINRELGGRFDLKYFDHTVRWNAFNRRVELYLRSKKSQEVYIGLLGRRFTFLAGETIRTKCSYKFSELELETLPETVGFRSVKTWIDIEWAFAEVLWSI